MPEPAALHGIGKKSAAFSRHGPGDDENLSRRPAEVAKRSRMQRVPRFAPRHERRGIEEDHC